MCETQRVQYSYEMIHPNYPHSLRVGGDCAEMMMEGDLKGLRRLHANIARRTGKWRPVKPGMPHLGEYWTAGGYRIDVWPLVENSWMVLLTYRDRPIWKSSQPFSTVIAAKHASLDKVEQFEPDEP
jgi:hypothetical protein